MKNKGLKVVAATLVLGSILNLGMYVGTKSNNQSFAQETLKENSKNNSIKKLSDENAKKVMLSKVNGEVIGFEYDKEDNDFEGKIKKDNFVYEIDVDNNGDITKFEKENIKIEDEKSNKSHIGTKKINKETAKKVIASKLDGDIVNLNYDSEDNKYEAKVKKGNDIYEIEVSGADGKVVDLEKDNDYDDINED